MTNSGPAAAPEVMGRTEPRLWTPPLRDLNHETSYGFDVIDFADHVLGEPLDPWQEWLVIHIGELLPDGRPRFRTVLVIVARQQGKSHLCRVLTLYWMFVEQVPLVLSTNATLGYAKEQWTKVVETATGNRWLADELPSNAVRRAAGEECLTTVAGSRYKIAASNRRAGRSLTVDRLIADELREQDTFDAWGASTNATNARRYAQIIAISNQGDDTSVVLDSLRQPALDYLSTGQGDRRLGLFEWSCPAGSDPADPVALAYANPDLGRRTDVDALIGAGARAKAAGGLELATFRTEVMCQKVDQLDPAIDPDLWDAAGIDGLVVDLAEYRDQVALCLDVSLAGDHAALVAAALIDGIVHVDVVRDWSGHGAVRQVAGEVPDLVRTVQPRQFGWFPNGPAAAVHAEIAVKRRRTWPPRKTQLVPITSDTAAVCMALPGLVANELWHPNDPMLTAHVKAGTRLVTGARWTFGRGGAGPVDGLYALAGAVHLARTMPPPRRKRQNGAEPPQDAPSGQ